ncbi:MAG TPA: enterotoxin [Terracidiphilus sp.]|nr:enterotoxin [Terracidiphilus sp.]
MAKTLTFAFLLTASLAVSTGTARGQGGFELRGERLTARFEVVNGGLKVEEVVDRRSGAKLSPGEAFSLQLRDGRVIAASQMKMRAAPVEEQIAANPAASRAAEQVAGRRLCAELSTEDNLLAVHWCAMLREGANYLRQEVTLKAGARAVDIAEVRMFDFDALGAEVVGKVPGSPMVAGDFFLGFEFPLSASVVKDGRATAVLTRVLPLEAGNSITYSSVIGVAAPGQMRRDFLKYIEQERAHPYRTFLHYNSWYDLGYFNRFNETEALDRVHAFGDELVKKRGVKMDSFLFDDGWDDPQTLWHFNPGLPNGFTKIHEAAEQYGFGIGVWLSPWGGYSTPKKQRIAAGEKAGYETVKGGFALSAPKYYKLFESTCLEMVTKYGVNQFKFDGTGNASTVFPSSLFDSDFSAAIHLIERLRKEEPNIFINLTTGTRPSPFWLRYADSIWRDGDDHSFDGVGSWRQKWITYRDEQTYRNIVIGGPLYPLNSLMLHGIIYAEKAKDLNTDPGGDFRDEVHDYFGTGTQLQEMYISPGLLTKENWDDLAESAKWSRANAAVLKDTHWIGGDPGKLEVYGWASWTPEKGIVVLRNPSDKTQEFLLDVGEVFELPEHAARSYRARSPWTADKGKAAIRLRAVKAYRVVLKPFEVVTLDCLAGKQGTGE